MNTPISVTALTESVKDNIQASYRSWLAQRTFKPRRGQREMIAHIARVLAGDAPRIAVVEAGTGTGKTAAYCLAAIPLGRALGKTLVISTATVALQEQIVNRDLPDLAAHANLEFQLVLAKGRGRYLCIKRLDEQLQNQDNEPLALFDSPDQDYGELYQQMLQQFSSKRWNGERDSFEASVADDAWRGVSTDHRGCSNNRCGYFHQCPFFQARAKLDAASVVVANHDLVLADLSLGGGAILPEPEDCIFIIDEAHHLPEKTQQHFANQARLRGTGIWLDQVTGALGTLAQRLGGDARFVSQAERASGIATSVRTALHELSELVQTLPYVARDERTETYRFPLGQIPAPLQLAAAATAAPVTELARLLDEAYGLLQKAMDGELLVEHRFEAEDWLPVIGALQARAEATQSLLQDYGQQPLVNAPRYARWANRTEVDCELVSAPIDPGSLLAEHLWQRAYGAVCTSATLTALGHFQRFIERAGLAGIQGLRIPSPFDYPNLATLRVPEMTSDPRDFDQHTQEVAELLPGLLADASSGLLLFTSWRQLNAVRERLDEKAQAILHIQGDRSKQALISAHQAAVDAGEPSYLVGLASFSEGLDLPDDYCRHVIIVKLPFAVPDDPVDQALAEWAEAEGRNAFYDIALPDAALRLVQACGRLIRHEKDHGLITLLDKRIISKRYGQVLLESLPPYRLELNQVRSKAV